MAAIPSKNDDVKSRISKLFFEESLCDVTFLVNDLSHRCHKLVLASGSKVFEAMLYGKMAENESEIRIPDVTETGFRIMLRYLYTDTAKFENEFQAFEAAYCGKKYLIDNLIELCESYLLSHAVLSFETVLSLYEKAAFLELKKLQNRCLSYVSRHASKILISSSMLFISIATFQRILELEFMDIKSEKTIIESLWKWGEEQCKKRGVDKCTKNIRNSIEDLLKYVRFLTLGFEELEDVFQHYDLLDNSEQLAILWNIAMSNRKESVRLPSNLCVEFKNRSIKSASRLKIPTKYRYNEDIMRISTKRFKQYIRLSVEGSGITMYGLVVAMKPIPCYSFSHIQLKIDITLYNETTKQYSRAKIVKKADNQECNDQIEEVLFDEFLRLDDGDIGSLTVETTGEGVKIMEFTKEEFTLKSASSVMKCNFKVDDRSSLLFPVKELICIPD